MSGEPSATSCDDNINREPHFTVNPVPMTLYDPDTTEFGHGLVDQCGDLVFNGRARSFEVTYATWRPGESPYKYWWQRWRDLETGATLTLGSLPRIELDSGELDSARTIEMSLDTRADAVATVLLISDESTYVLTDSAFVDGSWYAVGHENIFVQHWRTVPAPVLDSAVRTGDLEVTLYWRNGVNRDIDSTMVFRDHTPIKTLGHGVFSYTDTVPSSDTTYLYALKHVTWPLFVARGSPAALPNSASSDSLQVTVASLATACATPEYLSTWKRADQYLSAGCSELGPSKRFRWQPAAGAGWTAWTTDTLYDFLGHTQAGARIVVLQDSNTSTGATSRDTLHFTVASQQVTLHGPTLIRDKARKTYWADSTGSGSPHSGQWFERYDDGPRWYVASAYPQDTLKRIWPYGDYYEDLRQHRVTQGVLHRGRLHVIVCSIPSCEPNAPPPPAPSPSVETAADWGLFGLGPWLTWGSREGAGVLRLYDLWGNPERETAFGDAGWIAGPGGQLTDAATGWAVTWAPRELGLTDARAFDVAVAGASGRPYVLGLAADPDLGPDGGDDVASYDSQRGLVVVADGGRAAGFLFRDVAGNAIGSLQEYGVGQWAPITGEAVWAAQRDAGVRLVGTPRDVQLVLSAPETVGAGRWLFVIIRGDSPSSVRATTDAVLRVVR
jgi:hypothetical protein